ncbi:hypothetical protein PCANC_06386 [Puccinia coronata f. sp. avenae]|uniref:Uncharacterized protein n=1 Tax=Puccinia coronata f. sp. avenae TaxID=200324 RepID=A0A2N5VVV9_9BASI|nr:hypothetical protein PCANC_06386 [Puccinia coronata f. sp. avenae]
MCPLPANRNVLLIKWKQLFFQRLHNSQLQQLAALVVKDAEEAEVEALKVAEVTGADEAAESPPPQGHNGNGSIALGEDPLTIGIDDLPHDDPTDDVQDEEGLSGSQKRQRLDPQIMEELSGLSLDELRQRAAKHGKYQRLTAEDRLELLELYFSYQRQVYLLVCKNRLQVNPALAHLGLLSRFRGPTNFNNYSKYNEVASVTYNDKSIDFNERMRLLGLMWEEVDKETKEKWKDREFLESKKFPDAASDDGNQPSQAPPSLPRLRFKLNKWARDMRNNLRKLSTQYHIEGFVVLTLRDPDSNMFTTGGTLLGEQFLDMLNRKSPNPCRSFYAFVSGQAAIKDVTGVMPPPPVNSNRQKTKDNSPFATYNKGLKGDNLDEARALLNKALCDATHGTYTRGWPGLNTQSTLENLGVILKVKANDHGISPNLFCGRPSDMSNDTLKKILWCFGEGYVELKGPKRPERKGGEIGGNRSNDSNNDENNDVAVENQTSVTQKRTLQSASGRDTRKKRADSGGRVNKSRKNGRKRPVIVDSEDDTNDEEPHFSASKRQERSKKRRLDLDEDSSFAGSNRGEDVNNDTDFELETESE